MPRDWSTDLQNIHKAYRRRDTLVLYLSDDSALYLSRGNVTRGLISYNNAISSVSDVRQSMESSVDRVTVNCQNVDSLLGFQLASNLRLLDYAVGEYGRIYQSERNLLLKEDIPKTICGVLANAEVNEERIAFELIADYESLGSILASRSLSPRCWWTYKNGIECTSTSSASDCSKTRSACIKRGKEHEFGGSEFFEEPASNLPGSGGNEGGIGIGNECFTGKMSVMIPEGEISFIELNERFLSGKKSIISVNPHDGELVEDEIEEMWISERTGFFTFRFDHTELEVTNEHPFLVDWGLFKPADGFNRLDTTKAFVGKWIDSRLNQIKWNSDITQKFYCCKVKKNHTLLVNKCAVHNRSELPTDF